MEISKLTKDLELAVKAVASNKGALVAAQDALDKAKTAYDEALNKARDLHGALAAQIAEIVPGLGK